MKITIFLGSLGGGGAERVACNLANHLICSGHDVEMLTMADADAGYQLSASVKKTCLLHSSERRNAILDNYIRIKRLKEHMKSNNTDCYVVMLAVTTILMLFLRKYTKATVVAAERVDPARYPKIKQILLKSFANRADKWVFQTEEIRRWYSSAIAEKKCVIIPNAINEVFIRPEYKGEREKRIVGVGRLTNQKNFKLLIDAFSRIAPDFPKYCLNIYGEGPNRKALEDQITELGLQDRVKLPGYVDDIVEQLERSSLFVLSSDYEGMPNALIEAMALGLPCISTDCGGGGAKFLIEDGINGMLIPVCDSKTMSEKMQYLLSYNSVASEIGKNARKIVDSLDPDHIYGEWERVISNK